MKKKWLLWGVLAVLLACPDTSSSSDGGGTSGGGFNGGNTGGGGSTGGGDGGGTGDGGSGGGSSSPAGTFSVALSSSVEAGTKGIIAPGTGPVADSVEGLAIATTNVKAGKPIDSIAAAKTMLEVWLDETDYSDASGTAKNAADGNAFVLLWDAHETGGDATVSLKSASATTFVSDKVTIAPSETGKNARRKVQIGAGALAKGVTVTVEVYPHGSAGDPADKLAEYALDVTAAAEPDLTGAQVSANGVAAASAPTKAAIDARSLMGVTVTLKTGSAPLKYAATVTLALRTAATSGQKVAFNNFKVSGGSNLTTMGWTLQGSQQSTGAVFNTMAGDGGVDGNTPGNSYAVLSPVSANTRADFAASTSFDGKVTLSGEDSYGQTVSVEVTLDDKQA